MTRPIALVTGEVSPYRVEPFRMLADAEGAEVLVHGRRASAGPARAVTQAGAARLIANGRYRAVICGIGGRVALPATYLAARRARIPFILWTSLWAHPSTPAHLLSWPLTVALYRRSDAVVTYGKHVTGYVSQYRRGNIFEAPQAVSAREFARDVGADERAAARAAMGAPDDQFLLLYVGRLEREKGVEVLLDAWSRCDGGVLALVGQGPLRPRGDSVHALGAVERDALPAYYAAADATVLPSIRTATFLEPWGLVVNEAMHQGTPPIASDAVGAAAGGLVRDGRNGLVVPAGDVDALAARIRALASNATLRSELGAAAAHDVQAFSEDAWVAGMQAALRAVGAARSS